MHLHKTNKRGARKRFGWEIRQFHVRHASMTKDKNDNTVLVDKVIHKTNRFCKKMICFRPNDTQNVSCSRVKADFVYRLTLQDNEAKLI